LPADGVVLMPLHFVKMHGLGNDYVYVDCFAQTTGRRDWPALARAMSDRHRGVGSDGLILIAPPTAGAGADVRMEMYNADGSRGEMCGNGIRCVAKYAVRRGLVPRTGAESARIRVQTDCGVSIIEVRDARARVASVRVEMGRPILAARDIPVHVSGDRCVRQALQIDGRELFMTSVSMGNPHCVVFVEDVSAIDLPRLGPLIERHPAFPNRTNAHFVAVRSRSEVAMRTWERGAGATQACGSGACAVTVAGVLEGRLDRRVTCHLPGGDLEIEWPTDDGSVSMTGPAEEVFEGVWLDGSE